MSQEVSKNSIYTFGALLNMHRGYPSSIFNNDKVAITYIWKIIITISDKINQDIVVSIECDGHQAHSLLWKLQPLLQ